MTENRTYRIAIWPWGKLCYWLTEPALSIKEPGRRRQARLLASLLVSLITLIILVGAASALFDPSTPVPQNPQVLQVVGIGVLFAVPCLSWVFLSLQFLRRRSPVSQAQPPTDLTTPACLFMVGMLILPVFFPQVVFSSIILGPLSFILIVSTFPGFAHTFGYTRQMANIVPAHRRLM